jgi:hypothetical protein
MSMGISAATWGMIGAGAAVGGTLMNASANGDAIDAQTQSAAEANATQRYIFDQSRADQMPFLKNGTAASNKLAQLLGLAGSANGSPQRYTVNDLIDTSAGDWRPNGTLYADSPEYRKAWDDFNAQHFAMYGVAPNISRGSNLSGTQSNLAATMNLDGYNNRLAETVQTDPSFGSLMKPITRADIEADPVYSMGLDFGLSEGRKGIERQAAATGSSLSGATLKALTKYGNDYASTKGNDSVNRIRAGRQQDFSMLSGMAGGGQAAAGQTQAAGANYGNNVSATTQSLGNARGASMIAGANSINNGISQGIGYYQNNQLLQALQRNGGAASIYNGGYNFDNGNMISGFGS